MSAMRGMTFLPLLAMLGGCAGAGGDAGARSADGWVRPYIANAFEGPDRPDADVAQLWLHEDVRFVSLDGRPAYGIPRELPTRTGKSKERLIRLLPGTHRIVVGIPSKRAPGPERMHLEGNRKRRNVQPPIEAEPSREDDVAGSSESEELEFTVRAGREYMVRIRIPPDGGGATETWSAKVVDKTGPESETLVSTSVGRVPDGPTTRPLKIARQDGWNGQDDAAGGGP